MAGTARGPYKNGIKRRGEILRSAAKVFAQKGYAGGSLRQIADEVGVSPAALIRHFPNKESLYIAVLDYWANESDADVPAGEDGLGYFTRFRHLMKYHTQNRGLIELFLTLAAEASQAEHPARSFMSSRYDALIARSADQLLIAARLGEVRPFTREQAVLEVRGLFAMMDGIELQWLLDAEMDLVATFEYQFQALLDRWTGGDAARAHEPAR